MSTCISRSFFKAANNLFKSTSLDDWKTYLRWHLINATAPDLSKDFVNEDFDFNERRPARHEADQAALETRGHFRRTATLAKRSASCTWLIISRRKRKRARSNW